MFSFSQIDKIQYISLVVSTDVELSIDIIWLMKSL